MQPFLSQRPQPEPSPEPQLPDRESHVPEDFPQEVPPQQPPEEPLPPAGHCSRYSPLPARVWPQSSRKAKAVVSRARKPKPRMQAA